MGHVIAASPDSYMDFGAGQFIVQGDDGYVAASDPRRDGQAAGLLTRGAPLLRRLRLQDRQRQQLADVDALAVGLGRGERRVARIVARLRRVRSW